MITAKKKKNRIESIARLPSRGRICYTKDWLSYHAMFQCNLFSQNGVFTFIVFLFQENNESVPAVGHFSLIFRVRLPAIINDCHNTDNRVSTDTGTRIDSDSLKNRIIWRLTMPVKNMDRRPCLSCTLTRPSN